ncbi:MAG: hypothetical protein V3S09_05160 [Candidatus Bathyarchaeia archaeon]
MVENSLHEGVKLWYAEPGDLIEENVEGYLIDVVRGEQLIEIQTGNFSAIKKKLAKLILHHRVRLVHPVSQRKWIVRIDPDGETISRRRSPRRGRVEDVFLELVYMPNLIQEPNFSLEVLLIHSEEILKNDGRGSWRRRGWSIHDRRLLEVVERHTFSEPRDFHRLLPDSLHPEFTTRQLSEALGLRRNIAQKMVYTLRHMEAIQATGKKGRARVYSIKD